MPAYEVAVDPSLIEKVRETLLKLNITPMKVVSSVIHTDYDKCVSYLKRSIIVLGLQAD